MQDSRARSLGRLTIFLLFTISVITSCGQAQNKPISKASNGSASDTLTPTAYESAVADPMIKFMGATVDTRFLLPDGYERVSASEDSYASYLRKLPLKVPGSKVTFYDGAQYDNDDTYAAVVDLPIGDKDLHQCADAIMRLRAEYLWLKQDYDKIHFNFTNGMRVDYSEWMKGKRIEVNGNDTKWVQKETPSNSYSNFWNYLEQIFMFAGTQSLSKELRSVDAKELSIGDIFIVGGHPGHAVTIVDMAENADTKKKILLLAQSYMPAQELHIIKNKDSETSPWFEIDLTQPISLTSWNFQWSDLKRFRE